MIEVCLLNESDGLQKWTAQSQHNTVDISLKSSKWGPTFISRKSYEYIDPYSYSDTRKYNNLFIIPPGYGHSTPNTIGGKLFTMFYAMVGIPLGLVMFQSIGERLNKLSSVVIRKAKRLSGCTEIEATEINLICVVTTLSSLTIAVGAAAFSRYEGWTYFDSVYYCFITLTTIGFGDMVRISSSS